MPLAEPAAHAPRAEQLGPLERGLFVLRAIATAREPRLRPGDVVRATGLARSPVDRITSTLIRLGYLRSEGRDLIPAPRLLELGNAYLSGSGLPDLLQPYANRLADELGESVSLIVPDGCDMRLIAQAVVRGRTLSLAFHIGDLLPTERCAAGAVLAADWDAAQYDTWRARRTDDPTDEHFPVVPPRPSAPRAQEVEEQFAAWTEHARSTGWALDDQLVAPGLVALAAPVLGPDGRAVCAVSVLSHTHRHSAEELREFALPRLTAATTGMTEALRRGPLTPAPVSGSGARPTAGFEDLDFDGAKDEMGPAFVQSLARGLTVMTALGTARGGMTLSAVAEAAALPAASARRALLTLVDQGYASVDGRRFSLLPRVLELGYAQLSGLSFTEIVQPHLVELVQQVRESASISVLSDDDVLYVARVATGRITSATISLGTRFPAYATSMGRVLLADQSGSERAAYLARVRLEPLTRHTLTSPAQIGAALDSAARDEHALVDQELEEGLRSIAVPIRGRDGHTVAALNVALHAGHDTPQDTRRTMLPPLRATAARIEADLAAISERTSPAIP
ncbi:IclR family transcriptional regulator C-terminal domain-containing protein [Streptomyces sp. NPDC005408]|uniref:IclR family transcriptional regulator domain-containing protein n=1 Tax=Streptomyces sp. NPDC005408 TaxID=3155341 RepID=UPI0033A94BBD